MTNRLPLFVVRRASIVAMIVGPILVVINQWSAVTGTAPFDWFKVALTVIVPFCVSLVSSLMMAKDVQSDTAERETLKRDLDACNAQLQAAQQEAEALREDQRRAPAPEAQAWAPPPTPKARPETDHKMRAASDALRTICSNANAVNGAATKRVSDIAALIAKFEASGDTFRGVGTKADEASTAVGVLSSELNSIVDSVQDLSQKIDSASNSVSEVVSEAGRFGEEFKSVQSAAQRISDLATKIRLLSLNASVEAARAGDAGKGFAVVAGEVRDLAEQANTDLNVIDDVIASLERSLATLLKGVDGVDQQLQSNRTDGETCHGLSVAVSEKMHEIGKQIISTSKETSSEMPKLMSLIDDVRQLKTQSETAVEGSAKNIALCESTLAALDEPVGRGAQGYQRAS